MHARTTFISQIETTKAMEPGERALDDPARPTQATAMWAAAFRELTGNPAPIEFVPMALRVVGAVALHEARLPQRAARTARAKAECRRPAAATASRRAGSPT